MNSSNFISFRDVTLQKGFWKDRYDLNKNVSLDNVRRRFEETGRFDALRFNFLKNGRVPHYFFDSDVAKWMEAVSYLIEKDRDAMKSHEALCDELIDCMERAQREDGYLNSHHQQISPELIFRVRGRHELYCAGHLIEAAIAYHKATGKDRFLRIMEKYCDLIERVFLVERSAAFTTPGHEEIELALYKLYRHTGKESYRRMADFFLSERGTAQNDRESDNSASYNKFSAQDDVDIQHLKEANGHSVRALYFYSGIADMAFEHRDALLYKNLQAVFEDISQRKMYITGGVGSTRVYEGFTVPFDLPNHTAYTESCASIGMMYFASRLRRIERDSRYGDVMERVLYNSALSSTSLDGKSFFYENPLEISLPEYDREVAAIPSHRERLPIKERVEVFYCSCCPPNINRFFAEIGSYLCTEEEDCLCVEQYVAANISSSFGTLHIEEDYAKRGSATISSADYTKEVLMLRVPSWSPRVRLVLDGEALDLTPKDGYLTVPVKNTFTLSIDFSIAPVFVTSDPRVRANVGRMALTYGPTVYCLEGKDNGAYLNAIKFDTNATEDAVLSEDFHGLLSITLPAYRERQTDTLYVSAASTVSDPMQAKFIPYYAFANRGESDLLVWVRRA